MGDATIAPVWRSVHAHMTPKAWVTRSGWAPGSSRSAAVRWNAASAASRRAAASPGSRRRTASGRISRASSQSRCRSVSIRCGGPPPANPPRVTSWTTSTARSGLATSRTRRPSTYPSRTVTRSPERRTVVVVVGPAGRSLRSSGCAPRNAATAPAGSSRDQSTGGESKDGVHHQSMLASGRTRAAPAPSPSSRCSARS